jgi:hypothetical protein
MNVPSSEIWRRPGWCVGTYVSEDVAAYIFKYSLSLLSLISSILSGQRELHVRGANVVQMWWFSAVRIWEE